MSTSKMPLWVWPVFGAVFMLLLPVVLLWDLPRYILNGPSAPR